MIQAIREAINTARENKDDQTLLLSLAWLNQLAKSAKIRGKIKILVPHQESLQYLKMKTKESNLLSLLGTVNLIEAEQLLGNVWSFFTPLTVGRIVSIDFGECT
jgi:Anaphase-promoting complex subunit 5